VETSPVAKKKAKPQQKPVQKPVASDATASEDGDEEEDDEEDDDSKALALAEALDVEEDDEQPVDEEVEFKDGQDVGKAPKPSKAVQKAAKAGKGAKEETGVVYVGRIPHGFFEHQMKSYFEQVCTDSSSKRPLRIEYE
jgi:nucleolar protein 15